MTIYIKNKDTLIYDEFIFKCCIGKNGFTHNKLEGEKKTPIGLFSWIKYILEYRKKTSDKIEKAIKQNMVGVMISIQNKI